MFETFVTLFILLELYMLVNPNAVLNLQKYALRLEEMDDKVPEDVRQELAIDILSKAWKFIFMQLLYMVSIVVWLFVLPYPVKILPVAMLAWSWVVSKFGKTFRNGSLSLQKFKILRTIDGVVSIGILVLMLWFH